MADTESAEHGLGVREIPFQGFDKSRGFTTLDAHRAAEELRMEEGSHSHDPMYNNTKKNR